MATDAKQVVDATKLQKIADFNAKQAAKNEAKQKQVLTDQEKIALKAKETPDVQEQKKKEEELRKKKEEEQANLIEKSQLQAQKAGELIQKTTEVPRTWIESLPTPGGIATIIGILIFFLLAVIPVNENGDTRLKLFWLTLTGKTHLAYTDTNSTPSPPPTATTAPALASGKTEDTLQPVDLVTQYRGVDFSLLNLFGD